jgi:hypothetical protein
MKRTSRVAAVSAGLVLAMAATFGFASAASAAPYKSVPTGPTGWTPDGPVHAILNVNGVTYVGGAFTGGVKEIDPSTGAIIWSGNANGDVRALAASGSQLLIGGAFTTVDGASHKKLASLDAATGAVNPAWKASAGGTVRDIVVNGNTEYFGGSFTKQNGQTQGGLGAVTVDTGKLVPTFTVSTDKDVFGLAITGSRLLMAGNYTHVNGSARNSLSSYNLTTGTLESWNPVRACSSCAQYWDIVVDGNTAFVGSSGPGGRLAAYDLTTGLSRWTKGAVVANGDVQALTVSAGELYAGGHFTTIGGQNRLIVAALSEAQGVVDPNFNANFVTSYPGVWALSATPQTLYVGGHFTAAGPTPPKRFPYLAFFPTV